MELKKEKDMILLLNIYKQARDQWYIKRQKRLDFINKRLAQEKHSEQVFNDLDRAAEEYYRLTSEKLPSIGKEPELSDFYHPSEGQKNAEVAFIILTIGGVSYIIWIDLFEIFSLQ